MCKKCNVKKRSNSIICHTFALPKHKNKYKTTIEGNCNSDGTSGVLTEVMIVILLLILIMQYFS